MSHLNTCQFFIAIGNEPFFFCFLLDLQREKEEKNHLLYILPLAHMNDLSLKFICSLFTKSDLVESTYKTGSSMNWV